MCSLKLTHSIFLIHYNMSKKTLAGAVTLLAFTAFSIFSISNALALEEEMEEGEEMMSSEPLTSARQLCKEATTNLPGALRAARAKGLSLQLSPEDVNQMTQSIKDYKKSICYEAKHGKPMPLSSARQLCKEATKNLARDIRNTRAKGLSLQIAPEEIREWLKGIRDYKKNVCKEARGNS